MSTSLLGPDGKPDMERIYAAFPQHGSGRFAHRTSQGHSFDFEIYRPDGLYEAVILSQPGYGNQPNGAHETHRLPGPQGYAKICFAHRPTNLWTAVALALWWAECTSNYIRNGGDWK